MKDLVKIYHSLPDKQDGLNWYWEAHEFCKKLAERHNLALPVVCAVVSSLSPATNWEQNKKDAVRLIELFFRGVVRVDRLKLTTYGHNVRKAVAILKGKLSPDDAFSMKTGPKTFNFYLNLLNPSDTEPVTIDRHAYAIAMGEKSDKKIRIVLYRQIQEAYRKSAEKLGIIPSQLQAVLWVNHRKENVNQFQEYQPF